MSYAPTASIETLEKRAAILQAIRAFFYARGVLEVETPILAASGITDPYLQNFTTTFDYHLSSPTRYYLQTSPEFHMKRLLSASSPSIFQISKAFRHEGISRNHNPEFTLLEWYRIGFNHYQLMEEVDALLQLVLHVEKADKRSYQDLFSQYLGIDISVATMSTLQQCAKENDVHIASQLTSKDEWLFLLLSHCIEPKLGHEKPLFVFDFPASQAALAKINAMTGLAHRFEVYYKGVELANGFHELQNAKEQHARFEKDNEIREEKGLKPMSICEKFIASINKLPDCAGVALGIDRLVMLALKKASVSDVISFSIEAA